MMFRTFLVVFALISGSANAACRQALALGLDVSGSVDSVEYRLQLDGLAAALASPAVRDVLLQDGSAPVRLAVYEWSGRNDQHLILPWTEVGSGADLQGVLDVLRGHQRTAGMGPTTALGAAVLTGLGLLETQSACWRVTLDISGDGPANVGVRPQDIALSAAGSRVTVNALVIGNESGAEQGDLPEYFESYVIRGPDAFVEAAESFADYAEAMERKLLRELRSIAVGGGDPSYVKQGASTPL